MKLSALDERRRLRSGSTPAAAACRELLVNRDTSAPFSLPTFRGLCRLGVSRASSIEGGSDDQVLIVAIRLRTTACAIEVEFQPAQIAAKRLRLRRLAIT